MKKMSRLGLLIVGAMVAVSALATPTNPNPWKSVPSSGAHPTVFSGR